LELPTTESPSRAAALAQFIEATAAADEADRAERGALARGLEQLSAAVRALAHRPVHVSVPAPVVHLAAQPTPVVHVQPPEVNITVEAPTRRRGASASR